MDKIFLRIITLISPVLSKSGINTAQLYEILKVKLMMDERRPNAMFAGRKNTANSTKVKSPWFVTFMTLLMGTFISLTLFLNSMPYVGQTFYFLIFMVLMTLTLISDFTTVLMDPRDQYILLPRPVNDRTVAVSRILHISFYVLRLALLQGLPGMVIVGFIDGIAAVPLLFIQILQATLLSILFVNIIYLALMKYVSPQRFKDIISYFQIVFSVLIFGSYYLLPKLINVSVLDHISLISHWWSWFLPPVWIAALNELLIHSSRAGVITIVLAAAGILTPIIGLWMVINVFAPGFNKKLAAISTSDDSSNSAVNTKRAGKFTLIDKIAAIVAPDPVENAGFKITWKLSARLREFKLKVYPAFAYVPIYFLYFMLNGKGNVSTRLNELQNGHAYIFLIYLCTFILSTILMNISMTEKYKSSWIYYAAPIGEPGKILSGMYKAIIVLYFLPYCLVIGIITISIWGPQAINDILLAISVCITYGMIMALFTVKGLPFSRPVVAKQGGGRVITSLVILGLIFIIGYGHYYIMQWETVVWILIIPAIAINLFMFRYYKKQTWNNIELADID